MIEIITNFNNLDIGTKVYAMGYESIVIIDSKVEILPNLACLIPSIDVVTTLIEDNLTHAGLMYFDQLDANLYTVVQLLHSTETVYIFVTPDELDLGYMAIFYQYMLDRFNVTVGVEILNIMYNEEDNTRVLLLNASYACNYICASIFIEAVIRYNYIDKVDKNLLIKAANAINYKIDDIKVRHIPIRRNC